MNIEKVKILFKKHWFLIFSFFAGTYFSNLLDKIFDLLNNVIIEKFKGIIPFLYKWLVSMLNFKIPIYSLLVGIVVAIILNKILNSVDVRFRKLRIIEAKYGKNGRYINITRELNNLVEENKLKVVVGNSIAGDPLVGINKEAIVRYKINGKPGEVVVPEYQVLELA